MNNSAGKIKFKPCVKFFSFPKIILAAAAEMYYLKFCAGIQIEIK